MEKRQSWGPLLLLLLWLTVIGPCGAGLNEMSTIDCGSANHAASDRCENTVHRAALGGLIGQLVPLGVGVLTVVMRRRRHMAPLGKGIWIALAALAVVIVLIAHNATREAVADQYSIGSRQTKKPMPDEWRMGFIERAGDGNRTRVLSLGS